MTSTNGQRRTAAESSSLFCQKLHSRNWSATVSSYSGADLELVYEIGLHHIGDPKAVARFTANDVLDLPKFTQALAATIAARGCLPDELMDDLLCLDAALEPIVGPTDSLWNQESQPRPRFRPPRTQLERSLESVLDYLWETEEKHFLANRSEGHIFRDLRVLRRFLERRLSESSYEPADVVDDLDEFGVCPICRSNDGYVNLRQWHWFLCRTHRIRWCIGENVFPTWRRDSPVDWLVNWVRIRNFRVIDPLR